MPIPVPSHRRRGGRKLTRHIPSQKSEVHSRIEEKELDRVVSLAIDLLAPISVIDDLVTVNDLLSFATQPTTSIVFEPLSGGAIAEADSRTGSGGNATYVPGAQAATGSNPARADLNGLALNTYQLKMAVAQAWNIKPNQIGGRAYRPYTSDHTTGHAIDIPGSGQRGWSISDWVIAAAGTYKVKYIIHNHKIWYPGSGWKPYTPSAKVRGFASDPYHVWHVHVSVY